MDNLVPSLDDKSSSSSSDSDSEYKMVTKEANMTPSAYLSSESTLATIKRKLPLDLNESHSKRLKLDPLPREEDSTILKYVSRPQEILPDDREKMAVELPATQVVGGIQDLKSEVKQLERVSGGQINIFCDRLELKRHRQRMEGMEREIRTSRRSRLKLHAANLLRKSLEKVMAIRGIDMPQGENDPKHERYAQAAKLIKRESWESDTNLPVKYWKALQDLPAFLEARNESAHEDVEDLARLLLTDTYYQKHEYHYWGSLFNFAYGATVETVVQRSESDLDSFDILSRRTEEEHE